MLHTADIYRCVRKYFSLINSVETYIIVDGIRFVVIVTLGFDVALLLLLVTVIGAGALMSVMDCIGVLFLRLLVNYPGICGWNAQKSGKNNHLDQKRKELTFSGQGTVQEIYYFHSFGILMTIFARTGKQFEVTEIY